MCNKYSVLGSDSSECLCVFDYNVTVDEANELTVNSFLNFSSNFNTSGNCSSFLSYIYDDSLSQSDFAETEAGL